MQLFQPQTEADVFLSMMTPDVSSGRRHLGANTIWVMRAIGMRAYQTLLLPHLAPAQIKALNHQSLAAI